MGEVVGFAYFVIGGLFAGKVLVAQFDMCARDPEIKSSQDLPIVGIAMVTLLAWLAWPVAWGVMRASTPDSTNKNGS